MVFSRENSRTITFPHQQPNWQRRNVFIKSIKTKPDWRSKSQLQIENNVSKENEKAWVNNPNNLQKWGDYYTLCTSIIRIKASTYNLYNVLHKLYIIRSINKVKQFQKEIRSKERGRGILNN